MSIVKKSAKFSLYVFGLFILVIAIGGAYVYMNMGSIAKQISEKVASDALGVKVTINDIDISLEDKKIVVSGVNIANPRGYKNSNAIEVASIIIAANSLSKELINFSKVAVDGTKVNLEVNESGTNLGDIKNNIAKNSSSKQSKKDNGAGDIKVLIDRFSLTSAELNPSVTLLKGDLASVKVPDIHMRDIGKKGAGVSAGEAISQIMNVVLQQFNKSAGGAGLLQGLSLDALNSMGGDTVDALKNDLKKSIKEVDEVKKTLGGLKGLLK